MEYKLNTKPGYKDPYNKFWRESEKDGYFSKIRLQEKYLAKTLSEIKQLLRKHKDVKKIVDVGCGDGDVLLYLAQNLPKDIKLVGVDTSVNAIKIARSHLKKRKIKHNVSFKTMRPDMKTFFKEVGKDELFLLISLGHTIPHFINYNEFIKKLSKSKMEASIIEFHENFQKSIDSVLRGKPGVYPYGQENGKNIFLGTQSGGPKTVWRGHMIENKKGVLDWIAKCKQIKRSTNDIAKDFSKIIKLVKKYDTVTKWGGMKRFVFEKK